jgi:hypothetical protein
MLPARSGTDIEIPPIMAEDPSITNGKPNEPAEPPGGGRQDHAAMQRASMLPVSSEGSLDTRAASGSLEVPGRDPEASSAAAPPLDTGHPPERIPGERERDTLTHREPGAIGGRFNGADIPAAPPQWVDDDLARERAAEAGGSVRKERRASVIGPAPAGLAPHLDEPAGRTERKRETDE